MNTTLNQLIATGTYDEKAISKFHNQKVKQMERQNAKILSSPSLQKSYSTCDPIFFADQQVRQYLHTFEIRTSLCI
jgi:hypothetical protein